MHLNINRNEVKNLIESSSTKQIAIEAIVNKYNVNKNIAAKIYADSGYTPVRGTTFSFTEDETSSVEDKRETVHV